MNARLIPSLLAPLALLLAGAPSPTIAATEFTWEYRDVGAWISTGATQLQDQDDPLADPANLNAQVADESLFAMAFSHLGTDIQYGTDGLVTVTIHAFADLAGKSTNPPVHAGSQAWAYFQLAIDVDQPMSYTLAVQDYDVSGQPDVTTYEHFMAFNDPEEDGLLVAGQRVQLYGGQDTCSAKTPGWTGRSIPACSSP